MTRGDCAAQSDPTSPFPPVDRTRTTGWTLDVVAGPAAILDEPGEEAVFLLLGVPPGTFTTCWRGSRPAGEGSPRPATPAQGDISLLGSLGMAHWTDPDDILETPATDYIHATISDGRAQLFLGGFPWITRTVTVSDATLIRRRKSCLFGIYFHQDAEQAPQDVYDMFADQLFRGHAAVAEIQLTHS